MIELSPPPEVRIVPGVDAQGRGFTNVFVRWQTEDYGTRVNYVLTDTDMNRLMEARAFMQRQLGRFYAA